MFNESFWEEYWKNNHVPWDMGHISPPLKEYFDQLTDKSIKILIPGAGNAWEAEYLWSSGFKHLHIADISQLPLQNLKERVPDFPDKNIKHIDFFDITDKYDLIVEQTFFCALHPSLREKYALQVQKLLKPTGKLAGLLFTFPLDQNQGKPPFGGSIEYYRKLFSNYSIKVLEPAHNSHQARKENEAFIIIQKVD